ncbi:MAG: hypothetical protein EU541_00395 [Promethearchaeota archaeon]|nr:MAG: hypothetical protein EU541_00395 [Candidatus Lokiarchaeota archaeon]
MPKKTEKDEIPEGIVDEDGDEIIELGEDEEDDIIDEDIYEIEDEMLAEPADEDDFGRSRSEVEIMLRDVECAKCEGSSTRKNCKVRDDFGCPPDKANK